MYVKKNFNVKSLLEFSGFHMIWLSAWACATAAFYTFFDFEWMQIPWLPLSILGTAVAFYIGFKNNSAYDRLWEARKIWGAIVNTSRMWGNAVKGFVGNQFRESPASDHEVYVVWKELIYRHIAWLYVLRDQLLIPTQWEHIRPNGHKWAMQYFEKRRNHYGIGLLGDEVTQYELNKLLDEKELQEVIDFQNTATQLIHNQGQALKDLRAQDLIDDFRHMEMQQLLNELYTQQGKCERIKKFPLPRQYASMSFVFVGIFIFLLPFGLIPAFQALSPEWGPWIAAPFVALVGWVYLIMELVGDYSENPFEGMGNDVPMLSLTRTIEIDLREMLGEAEVPEAIKPVNNVLM
ncbi:MAG: bestrophin family ion channel [Bacteroidota bacterium]